MWDDILEGKVDSEIRGQVIHVQKQNFNFFFCIQLGVVLKHTDNLSSSLQYTRHVINKRSVNCKSMLFKIASYEGGS